MDWKLILQIIGVLLGLLYLYLEYKANIWLWVVGLIMPIVHGALYFRQGLYADFSMEIYYILAGIYGLIVWKKTKAKSKHKRVSSSGISRTPLAVWVAIAGVYTVLHAAIYTILVNFTDSTVPFWGALTTALSVVAYWLLSRKFIEQWFVWLAVDIVCVGLYIHKDIPLTASLYALYSVLAIVGYLKWKRIMRAESEGDSTFNC